MPREFVHRSAVPVDGPTLYAWHARPGAFERLSPPWQEVRLEQAAPIENGSRARLRMRVGPFWRRWVAEHRDVVPGTQFRDVQVQGPFAHWDHLHRFTSFDEGAVLEDRISYALPLRWLSHALAGRGVDRSLRQVFAYRHRTTIQDLASHAAHPEMKSMRILVTGASGLVGRALVSFLTTGGHDVVRLVRRAASGDDEVSWDPKAGTIDATKLEGLDAVVHLAGEGIADGRWNDDKKARIRESRTSGTDTLARALAGCERKPAVFVCASAIGYYGDRGDEVLSEESAPGSGFLPDVCVAWEQACEPARAAGIRVVNMRFGIVLSAAGGALKKMLLPFKLMLGGRLGSGSQWMSWIALDDVLGAVHHAIATDDLHGPVNTVSPQPVTNKQFTKTLGTVLRRWTPFPMPAFAARLAFGEVADALLLSSARVAPARLQASGYTFRYPDLEGALRHLLGRVKAGDA